MVPEISLFVPLCQYLMDKNDTIERTKKLPFIKQAPQSYFIFSFFSFDISWSSCIRDRSFCDFSQSCYLSSWFLTDIKRLQKNSHVIFWQSKSMGHKTRCVLFVDDVHEVHGNKKQRNATYSIYFFF